MSKHPIFIASRPIGTHFSRRFLPAACLLSIAFIGQNTAFGKDDEAKVNAAVAATAPAKAPQPKMDDKLAAAIKSALGTPGVDVQVFTGKDGISTALLSGKISSQEGIQKLELRANKLVPSIVGRMISLLQLQPAAPPPDPHQEEGEEEVRTLWQRTFVSLPLTSTLKTEQPTRGNRDPNAAESLAKALNTSHGGDPDNPLIKSQGPGTFYLHGPRAQVVAIERDLLSIDAVWPQVQMDMWTVQVSGNPHGIAQQMADIRERFDNARKAMQLVQSDLGDAAQESRSQAYFDRRDPLFYVDQPGEQKGLLSRVGFNPDCVRPLSLTEALIFIGLQSLKVNPSDGTLVTGLGQPQKQARELTIERLQQRLAEQLNDPRNSSLLKALNEKYKTNGRANALTLLPGLRAAYSGNAESDRAGVVQFLEAAYKVHDFKNRSPLQQERDVARLRTTAAASDRLLKSVTDAFASDMQDMFLKPVFDAVSKKAGSDASGVTLTGQTRMVVTSRIETGIAPSVVSYVETTRPKPLDETFLAKVFGAPPAPAASATPAPSPSPAGAAGGLAARFAGLSNLELLGLGAVLSQPEPELTRVSPGVAINVRPTVLPDGGSARLQLDFSFGVETNVENNVAQGDGRIKSVPAAGIKSNHVRTDITVSAFDLFNVSSFAIESSHPRSRYLPVIGSIPLLGELIKKPAKNSVTRHESIVLVNTTILPRIMDLTHFYGQ